MSLWCGSGVVGAAAAADVVVIPINSMCYMGIMVMGARAHTQQHKRIKYVPVVRQILGWCFALFAVASAAVGCSRGLFFLAERFPQDSITDSTLHGTRIHAMCAIRYFYITLSNDRK